jgi:hypothetical protein
MKEAWQMNFFVEFYSFWLVLQYAELVVHDKQETCCVGAVPIQSHEIGKASRQELKLTPDSCKNCSLDSCQSHRAAY